MAHTWNFRRIYKYLFYHQINFNSILEARVAFQVDDTVTKQSKAIPFYLPVISGKLTYTHFSAASLCLIYLLETDS